MGLRYHTKRAEIWWFGLVRLIHARFVGYLAPRTWINLPFALLKLCGLAGRFEYNKPQFEDNFFWP